MNQRFTRMLPVALTQDEKVYRGEQLGRALKEVDRLEAMKKEEGKHIAGLIAEQWKEADRLKEVTSTGTEEREVTVELHYEPTRRVMQTIRVDTGDVIDERGLTPDEQQEVLFKDVRLRTVGGTRPVEPEPEPGRRRKRKDLDE